MSDEHKKASPNPTIVYLATLKFLCQRIAFESFLPGCRQQLCMAHIFGYQKLVNDYFAINSYSKHNYGFRTNLYVVSYNEVAWNYLFRDTGVSNFLQLVVFSEDCACISLPLTPVYAESNQEHSDAYKMMGSHVLNETAVWSNNTRLLHLALQADVTNYRSSRGVALIYVKRDVGLSHKGCKYCWLSKLIVSSSLVHFRPIEIQHIANTGLNFTSNLLTYRDINLYVHSPSTSFYSGNLCIGSSFHGRECNWWESHGE